MSRKGSIEPNQRDSNSTRRNKILTKKILWAALLAVAVTGLSGCGSKDSGGGSSDRLATVAGDAITVDEFHKYLEIMPTAQVVVQNQVAALPINETLAFQALRDLVMQKIVAQMAKDEGVYPTDEEVTAEIKFKTTLNESFLKELNARGLDLKTIRKSIAQDLAQERLITKGITVTKEDVDQYIKDNPKQFVEPATADITFIYVRDDAAKKQVDQALASGQTFADVAVRLSQVPNVAQNGAKFPVNVIEQLPTGPDTNIKELIKSTPELKETAWVKFQGGQTKFYVDKKTEERPVSLDENRKEQIRRNLALQRGQQATDLQKRIADRMKEADIQIAYASLKDPWKTAMDKAKEADTSAQAPSTPTNPNVTPPTEEKAEEKKGG